MFQKCLSMYLGKARKQIEQKDQKEFEEKRSKQCEKPESDDCGLTKLSKIDPDDLPDGSCFRPKTVVEGSDDGQTAIRSAEVCIFWKKNDPCKVLNCLPSLHDPADLETWTGSIRH